MSKKGWFKEPARHALAAMGVKSPKKSIMVKRIKYKKVAPKRQWKCDNCGAWVDDDGSGNDHEGYTCARCGSCMYPEELARFYADGDLEAKMIWRDGKTPSKAWAGPLRTDSNSVYHACMQKGMSDAEAREYVLRNAPNEMRAEFPEQIPLEPASLGRGGKLVPSKSVTSSEVRRIVSDARFDINPYARTYIDALSDSEAMYGEHGVEVQAAYIATNLRANTPEQKEAKKLLQRIADGKYTGKKVVR